MIIIHLEFEQITPFILGYKTPNNGGVFFSYEL
jgi:hypothetical protein